MRGFDPEFVDIIDYILRITERIWEGKQVQLCLDYYSADCPVYTLAGLSVGAQEVTDNTAATQASFPDRTLRAEAVICGGDEVEGFHTSHLIYSEMTNLGASDLGPATGKPAAIFVIAHCIIKDNRIVEEWLVRDNYLLVQQLGLDPLVVARQKAASAPAPRDLAWRDAQILRLRATPSSSDEHAAGANTDASVVRRALHSAWAEAGDAITETYANNATVHISSGKTLTGHDDLQKFYASMRNTFANIRLAIDYVCQQTYRVHPDDTSQGTHVAARWTLLGEHAGDKLYGTPTNAPVLIMGESQCHVVAGRIVEEWSVFDELAVLTQIERVRASQTKA